MKRCFFSLLLLLTALATTAQTIIYNTNAKRYEVTAASVDPGEIWSFCIRTGDGNVLMHNAPPGNPMVNYPIPYTYKGAAGSYTATVVTTRKYNPRDPKNKITTVPVWANQTEAIPVCKTIIDKPSIQLYSNTAEALPDEDLYIIIDITSNTNGNLYVYYNDNGGFMTAAGNITNMYSDKLALQNQMPQLNAPPGVFKDNLWQGYQLVHSTPVTGFERGVCNQRVYVTLRTSNNIDTRSGNNYAVRAYFVPANAPANVVAGQINFQTGMKYMAHDPNNHLVNHPLLPWHTPIGTPLEYTINFENTGVGPVPDTITIDASFVKNSVDFSSLLHTQVYAELQGRPIALSSQLVKTTDPQYDKLRFVLLKADMLLAMSNLPTGEGGAFHTPSGQPVLLCGTQGDQSFMGKKRKGFIRVTGNMLVNDRAITGHSEIIFSNTGGEVVRTNLAETNFYRVEAFCPGVVHFVTPGGTGIKETIMPGVDTRIYY
jgi:hypothetical protein